MNALLRLLVVGRFAATVRNQAKIVCIRAAIGAVILILIVIGGGFLLAAGYQVLRWHYSGPVAAALIGGGSLLLAAIAALAGQLIIRRQSRRQVPSQAAPAGDPVSTVVGAVGSALSSIPPGVLVAAIAGFLYGLRGKGRSD